MPPAIARAAECFIEFTNLSTFLAILHSLLDLIKNIQITCDRLHSFILVITFVYIRGRLGFTKCALFRAFLCVYFYNNCIISLKIS